MHPRWRTSIRTRMDPGNGGTSGAEFLVHAHASARAAAELLAPQRRIHRDNRAQQRGQRQRAQPPCCCHLYTLL